MDDEILIDACWAISYLSDGSNDKIQAVIESGVCRRLVDLLMHPSTSVQTPALRSVGNIVTGDDLQTQVVIASGALPALLSLLSSPKEGIRKEACWTISNITAGSPPQIQAVVDANIIPPLINILSNADFKTRKEACWAISNATSGGLQEPSQIRYLVNQGCIKPLCDLLTMMDNKIIQVALDGLDNILKVGEMDKAAAGPGAVNQYAIYVEEAGGMITIHNLQSHDNGDIYKKAYNIMDKYFPDDEEVDTGAATTNVDASGTFAVSLRMYLSLVAQNLLTPCLVSSTRTLGLLPPVVSGSARRENILYSKDCRFLRVSLPPVHYTTSINLSVARLIEIECFTSFFLAPQLFFSCSHSHTPVCLFVRSLLVMSSPSFLIPDLSEWPGTLKNGDNLNRRKF